MTRIIDACDSRRYRGVSDVLAMCRHVTQWWPGGFSLRDLGADVVGTAAALALLAVSECAWRPRARRRLTFDDGDAV